MTDERDPLLAQLFAEQSPPANGAEFTAHLLNRVERKWRRQRAYRIGMIIAGVTAATLLAPWIAQVAALATGSVVAGVTAAHSALSFPMAGLVVCSMIASFLPVIYLGITRRW